jgi:hypothetical protein
MTSLLIHAPQAAKTYHSIKPENAVETTDLADFTAEQEIAPEVPAFRETDCYPCHPRFLNCRI